MAIAAAPIAHKTDLLDLIQQVVPLQEPVVELYRRLLAINQLASSMNAARDTEHLQDILTEHFREFLPNDRINLCIKDGIKYRNLRISGPAVSVEEKTHTLDSGIVEGVLKSGSPFWVPDTHHSIRARSVIGSAEQTLPRSVIIFPFSARGEIFGCLEMSSDKPNRFDKIEYHFGFLVAAHLSSSFENVLTRQELTTTNSRLKDHDLQLMQLNQKLRKLAHTDEGTGLYNKRRLFERLDMEIARARRYGEILSCLMLDIDDFKKINDTYGHQAGDEILRQIGALLRGSLRITDFVARYGGEEFTVLLPRTNFAGASRVAENLRKKFMLHDFRLPPETLHLTVSIGAACCTTFDRLDAQQIIQRADNALYLAKRAGKNRYCFADESEHSYEEVRILSIPTRGFDTGVLDR